ncbi:MAG: CRISPR-associated endonuclease Cas2 [Candidatus Cloacimonadales bacterium]|jgi:CRISPR-associated endonuclease Cas2|nr:CRISPR-associated endonuclease Cas2 [Candidatus Cloacimonadales bacterium]
MKRIIAFDIYDEKVKLSLLRFLEKHGVRIQESVFVADINTKDINSFMKNLEKINQKKGKLHVFSLCKDCEQRAVELGNQKESIIII